jgi:hypothetical protein
MVIFLSKRAAQSQIAATVFASKMASGWPFELVVARRQSTKTNVGFTSFLRKAPYNASNLPEPREYGAGSYVCFTRNCQPLLSFLLRGTFMVEKWNAN